MNQLKFSTCLPSLLTCLTLGLLTATAEARTVARIYALGHAAVKIEIGERRIYIDPYNLGISPADADIVLITHQHYDHLSPGDIDRVRKTGTAFYAAQDCVSTLRQSYPGTVTEVSPGWSTTVDNIRIEAVRAYNVVKTQYHPIGSNLVGFIVTVEGVRIYHAGDTERIPEMQSFSCDIALMPLGQNYTMNSVAEAANATRDVRATTAIPIHWGVNEGSRANADAYAALLAGQAQVVIDTGTDGFAVIVPDPLLTIGTQPASQHVAPGGNATFGVTATTSEGVLTYQWKLNGAAIAGATNATFTVANVQAGNMGFYSVTVGNGSSSVDSDVAILTVNTGRSRLTGLSTRGYVPAGGALTPGFYLRGAGSKSVIVRGVGPTLGSFGVAGTLSDPRMDLIPVGGTTLLTNDDWGTNANLPALRAAMPFALAEGSRDSAALTTLSTATNYGYTVRIVPSGAATAGIAMAEVYDLEATTAPVQFASLSTLGFTGTGENLLTPGFIITGNGPKQLLIRAVGPTLANYGVGGLLADPQFQVVPLGQGYAVASNDNWRGTAALQAAFAQTQAFALPADSRDAAAVVRLPPGGYTVQATGVGNTIGNVLVEVYDMDP